MNPGNLYLIPALLGDSRADEVIPSGIKKLVSKIEYFVVEDLRSARRLLKKIDPEINIDALQFELLNEHTDPADIPPLLGPLLKGRQTGLMSEAGSPCVADPGSSLVALAHEHSIKVVPLSGPSSINLALMASGFNGQHFVFHGYLPVEHKRRISALKSLEQQAYQKDQTQIFIETPYRNIKMFESILSACSPSTRLCIAANITTPDEIILTRSLSEWKKQPPDIHKQPAVFLLYK